jgi:hypothetical protein
MYWVVKMDHNESIQPKKKWKNLLNIFCRLAASSEEVCNFGTVTLWQDAVHSLLLLYEPR